jgi:hypothetical protein
VSRRAIRIATTKQLERSVRETGFDTYVLPDLPTLDFNRSLQQRLADGPVYRPFLEKNDIDLVLDFNTEALTLVPSSSQAGEVVLTTANLGIPYVACYLDPITSTMAQVGWADHWQLLESRTWIKWIPETTHSEELSRFGIPNIVTMPMAAANDDFDTNPLPEADQTPAVAFMGHPASSWFGSQNAVLPGQLFAGLTAASVRADMPDLTFHKIYYDLYQFATPPAPTDDFLGRARKAAEYYGQKFVYNAYLAIKQRDRFARFLKIKLGDTFELIGDHWKENYGLKHTPRIWDMKVLHERMRRVAICLNLVKGNWETGLIIRHFEVPAYGGFQLVYHTAELSSCFEIGKECDVFHDEAELLDKIHYYLNHSRERREIAAAGQRRVLSEHLYSHRITKLVDLLRQAGILPKKGALNASPVPTPKIHVQGVTDEPVEVSVPAGTR